MAEREEEEEEEEEGILDLTGSQLDSLTEVEFAPDLREIDLTANRLTSLDPRFATLSNLKKLSLRQNLLSDLSLLPLSHLSGLQVDHLVSLLLP